MESHVKLLGHPLHQMLVMFPVGLLAMAVVFDVIAIGAGQAYWSEIAYWMIAAGVVTALLAAPFGLIDWLAIPRGTRAKRIGAVHGIGNLIVVLLFAGSWLLRDPTARPPAAPELTLSFLGAVLLLMTGWLGGELVDRLSVGVDDNAHVDAPSSLRSRRVSI
jgi:uncharacterized membrane protein